MDVTKAFVFASKEVRNDKHGWIYVFIPGLCGETRHTIELIDLDSYNRLRNTRCFYKTTGGFLKKDLANMPMELLAVYENYMYNEAGIDLSDKMNELAQQCIDADKVAKCLI